MDLIPEVTLLITHYNRSNSLERLLLSFNALEVEFANVVVSDDGSKSEHLERLKVLEQEFGFNLVTTPINKGLGNNINKGQDKVTTKYTLYVQEDFVPQPLFKQKLKTSLTLLGKDNNLDMIRFYAYFKYPFLKSVGDGFSEMKFSVWPWFLGYKKFYYYSDHPHIKRSNFFEKFGRYPEGIPVERTEYRMMMSFLKNKGKSLFYDDYTSLFSQENSAVEPSTVKRNYWRETKNPLVVMLKHTYRYLRFNMDYVFHNK
jgi:glycosyltransferase involved in cell wall biosynthesis